MRLPIARALGAFTLAAVLTTSATAYAASPDGSTVFAAAKQKKATTLVSLSPTLRTSAIQKAHARPGATGFTTQGRTSKDDGMSDLELDGICADDWFIYWDEDEN